MAIYDLMEDAATAEIARCQVWQWLRHGTRLADGRPVDHELVAKLLSEEYAAADAETEGRDEHLARAGNLFNRIALRPDLPEFFTTRGYATYLAR